MAGISNTSRTLKYLREKGWDADMAERWIRNPKHPAGGFRRDLFNIIDIIALTEKGIMGVQSCGQNFSAHDRKILSEPMSLKWMKSGGQLMLIGWRKVKIKRGGKAVRWSPRIKEYSIESFNKGEQQ